MQPAHLRASHGRLHEQGLLDVAIDDGVMVIGAEVQRRPRDLLAQPERDRAGGVAFGGGVELAKDFHARRRRAPEVGLGGIEARLQQTEDLFAGEQFGAHALGLELCAQRVDMREMLADRAAVRGHWTLKRR